MTHSKRRRYCTVLYFIFSVYVLYLFWIFIRIIMFFRIIRRWKNAFNLLAITRTRVNSVRFANVVRHYIGTNKLRYRYCLLTCHGVNRGILERKKAIFCTLFIRQTRRMYTAVSVYRSYSNGPNSITAFGTRSHRKG